MERLSFSSPMNLSEEGKWLLALTSFEATNSVFKVTEKNNSFSSSTTGLWFSGGGAEINNKTKKLLEMRHNNDIDIHVGEVSQEKRK